MTETRTNRKQLITDTAADLFAAYGYNATSVRQISEQVGCTEAALYYHFKDGKRALLQEVIKKHTPNFDLMFTMCKDVESINDLLSCLVKYLFDDGVKERIQQAQWLFAEYPRLSEEEQAIVRNKITSANCHLHETLEKFIPDEQRIFELSWTLVCAFFGFGQLFISLGIDDTIPFSIENLRENLLALFD